MMEFERRGRLRSLVWDGAVCLYLIVPPLPGAIVVRLRARGGVRGSLTTTGGWEDHDVGRMTLDLIGVEDMRIEGGGAPPDDPGGPEAEDDGVGDGAGHDRPRSKNPDPIPHGSRNMGRQTGKPRRPTRRRTRPRPLKGYSEGTE